MLKTDFRRVNAKLTLLEYKAFWPTGRYATKDFPLSVALVHTIFDRFKNVGHNEWKVNVPAVGLIWTSMLYNCSAPTSIGFPQRSAVLQVMLCSFVFLMCISTTGKNSRLFAAFTGSENASVLLPAAFKHDRKRENIFFLRTETGSLRYKIY